MVIFGFFLVVFVVYSFKEVRFLFLDVFVWNFFEDEFFVAEIGFVIFLV